jgi:hypothetical protein
MRPFIYVPGLAIVAMAASCVLAACGQVAPSETVPPTVTPMLPPGYETPTPIPPERQGFFIGMGDGASGVPAIRPQDALSTTTTGITKAEVEQYARTHEMRGWHARINYVDPQPSIVGIELVQWVDVYRRYMPEALLHDWQGPYPPETQVYLVELQGAFRFTGGPAPGELGTYRTGIWVFDARTGYDILEGGVGRIDSP